MRSLLLFFVLACCFACQQEQANTNDIQQPSPETEQKEPAKAEATTSSIAITENIEAAFQKIIVNEEGQALKFVSEEAKGRWLIFYPDGNFDADGDIPLRGKWRFREGKLELYYEEKDIWVAVPLEIYDDGSFKIHSKLMRPQY
jgi:hypothetical protein